MPMLDWLERMDNIPDCIARIRIEIGSGSMGVQWRIISEHHEIHLQNDTPRRM